MKILLKAATIVDPASKHHGKKRDVLIEKGIIKKIAVAGREKPYIRRVRPRRS